MLQNFVITLTMYMYKAANKRQGFLFSHWIIGLEDMSVKPAKSVKVKSYENKLT